MVNEVLLSAPLAASIIICVVLAAYVGLRSRLMSRGLYVLMVLMVAFLAGAFWLELIDPSLGGKLFWNDLEYIVNVSIPPLFLIFTATFLGRKVVRGKQWALLFIVPAIVLALLWTNDIHHLFYPDVWLENGGYYASFDHTNGIGFLLHSVYSLGVLTYTVALLVIYFLRSSPMQRRQVRLVLFAALTPPIAVLIGFQPWFPLSPTYIFVIGLTISGLLIFLGAYTYELFDVVPMDMESILETVDDGIIVASTGGKVVFANRTVVEAAGVNRDIYARPLSSLSPELTAENIQRAGRGERVELTLGRNGRRTFLLKATSVVDREGTTTSVLLTLRDVTEEKRVRESLKEANVKLNLLSSITRHDILNELTVVRGAGELVQGASLDQEQARRYGQIIVDAADAIERQFTFARDYQSLGVRVPEWQSAKEVFERALELGLAGGAEVQVDLDQVELWTDPMMERVFSVLLDNTARHGIGADRVSVRCERRDGGAIIIYEDNGVGVDAELKERIFERGFGRSGGLGLYLARQILDVYGAEIRETGPPGQGARFEIIFPPERWRAPPGHIR